MEQDNQIPSGQDKSFEDLKSFLVKTKYKPLQDILNKDLYNSLSKEDKIQQEQAIKTSEKGETVKGLWLRNKLSSIYSDPKFQKASPEQQQYWRGLAYDKWVSPYFKNVMKIDPPKREDWLANNLTNFLSGKEGNEVPIDSAYRRAGKEIGLHSAKQASDITGGLFGLGAYVGKAIDSLGTKLGGKPLPPGSGLESVFTDTQKYFGEKSKDLAGRLEDVHNVEPGKDSNFINDPIGSLTELGTSAVFFEATGGAKVAKALQIVNPKTASLALQMAKASWNGAVDYSAWSASQGDKPSEIQRSAELGAGFGVAAKLGQRKVLDPLVGMLKTLFKFGGKEVAQEVLTKAVAQASGESDETLKKLSLESAKAVELTRVSFDKLAQEKFKRPYKDLGYIQKQHILNNVLSDMANSFRIVQEEGPPKQITQALAKEEQDRISEIFPESKQAQQNIDKFIVENKQEPVTTKLLATLPHHNTSVDSSWKHLQARASFLKNQLSKTDSPEERKAITAALNDEYQLMKDKKLKQESSKPSGTVGGASVNDTRVFRDNYVVTPNVDPYNHGFTEWQTDSFAHGVAQQTKSQFIKNAISNSYVVAGQLARNTRLGTGVTKQLFHPQYGLVGGVNYEIHPDFVYINQLGMRPNVVSRVWPVKGGGQTLFLNVAMEAERLGKGISLTPYDESKSFYEKLGMHEEGSYMIMDKLAIKNLLKNKGLLMMLLGAGITYGADKFLAEGDYSVRGREN